MSIIEQRLIEQIKTKLNEEIVYADKDQDIKSSPYISKISQHTKFDRWDQRGFNKSLTQNEQISIFSNVARFIKSYFESHPHKKSPQQGFFIKCTRSFFAIACYLRDEFNNKQEYKSDKYIIFIATLVRPYELSAYGTNKLHATGNGKIKDVDHYKIHEDINLIEIDLDL
jgi:hypothetical protein